jgi:hypothetical protein
LYQVWECFKKKLEDAESAGYDLGEAIRDLGTGLGSLGDTFNAETSNESGLVRFINLLTSMVNGLDSLFAKLNAVLGPFAKLLEFSQRFAETESQRRIEPRLIPLNNKSGITGLKNQQ